MTLPLSQIVIIGLQYGLVLALLLSLLFIGLAIFSPEAWVNDYPPDIRAKFGPMSEQASRIRKLSGIPFAVFLLGSIALALSALQRSAGRISFLDAFVVIFVMLFVFNLVDLLVVDWLLFVTLQPRFIILPGTEGMSSYKDYGFHFKTFLKGLLGSAIGSLIIAGLAWALFAFVT